MLHPSSLEYVALNKKLHTFIVFEGDMGYLFPQGMSYIPRATPEGGMIFLGG